MGSPPSPCSMWWMCESSTSVSTLRASGPKALSGIERDVCVIDIPQDEMVWGGSLGQELYASRAAPEVRCGTARIWSCDPPIAGAVPARSAVEAPNMSRAAMMQPGALSQSSPSTRDP